MPEIMQRSFTSGEISPSLQSRADTVKYATGLNLCENFIVRAQGGVYSRPGLRFVGEVGDSSTTARLIPFSFNTEQTYVLLLQALTLRVIKDGAFVLKPVKDIINITQGNPARVTTNVAHNFVTGESVTISSVLGMTELNGNTYTITVVAPGLFDLVGVDSTGFGAYIAGGKAQSDGIYELATPYTEAQLPFLGFTQSADVMTIVHPSHDPRNLNRLAEDNWTLVVINYATTVTAPTFATTTVRNIAAISKANPAVVTTTAGHGFVTGNTIAIAGVVGMVELNGRAFRVTVIGSNQFELDGEDSSAYAAYISGGTATRQDSATTVGSGFGTFNKTYIYVVTAVDADGVESLASAAASIDTQSLTTTGGVRLQWQAVTGAEYYRVYKDPSNNTGRYGWIGDSINNTFDDFNLAPIASDAPPQDRQPFAGAGNKPSTVNYYQQRQVFANTLNEPQTVFTTQTANFNSLRTSNPARDDDAVTLTVVGRQVNEIRHIVSLDTLLLLTSGGEWKISEGQDQVLTPSTVGVRQQSYNGTSWVPPVVINSTALFLQEKGARVRDLGYEFSSDKYTGNDLSLMSEHLFEGFEITAMAHAAEPYTVLWCVRDDGVMLGLTYQREHQVWGWHQHTTNGLFESVTTIAEGNRDAPYVVVNRTINGQTRRFVERMDPREQTNAADCFYVDSGLTYSGTAATVISGLDHLEGEAVAVLADGYEVLGHVVTSGEITLARAATKVHVGLAYTPAIELLDIDIASATTTAKSRSVSVSKVYIEVEKSRGGYVGPRSDGDVVSTPVMREIKPRFESDGYDPIALKTYKQSISIEPQWSKGGGVRIEQRSPLPLAILSVIPSVDTGGN